MPNRSRYSNTSRGAVYDLISEGPIRLVNGLASVYLNKTPVANPEKIRETTAYANQKGWVNADGTELRKYPLYDNQVPFGTTVPILINKGRDTNTTTITAGSTTVTTSTAFFTSDMLGLRGNSGLYERIRIAGAGPGGSDYVGNIIQINSTTSAVLAVATETSVTSAEISCDFFTTGRLTKGPITDQGQGAGAAKKVYVDVELVDTVPNSSLYNDMTGGAAAQDTWTHVLYTSLDPAVFTQSNPGLNFNTEVNFRPGTLNQEPVRLKGLKSFSAASSGIFPNVELSQVGSVENNTGGTINIHGQKTSLWWTDDDVFDILPSTPGSTVTIDSGTGTYGLNLSAPDAVDGFSLTINFPSGLYGIKSNEEQSKRRIGALFQIVFKHKLTSETTYTRRLIGGPNTNDLTTAQGYYIKEADILGPGKSNGETGAYYGIQEESGSVDFYFDVTQFQPFDQFKIEISKITPDGFKQGRSSSDPSWQYVSKTTLASVQVYTDDKLSYPHSGYAAIAFDSNEFQGNFPKRAYHCHGVKHSLPTNYITREEAADGIAKYTRNSSTLLDTGTYQPWDGTFRQGFSNNPVWNLRELLTNKRWGLGNWITEAEINDYSLYSLARYCDELVPDGKGGLEPRFTCGVYLTKSTEAYKVIKDFCTTMLALPYWVDGQLILEGDRPAEAVYTFTKGNIIDGVFTYEGTGNRARVNQVAVTYNDADNFYEQTVELVDDIENIVERNVVNTSEVVAFGATTRGQAIRYGKWKLLTSKLQKELVSFKTSENASFLKPGSIIKIQDADRERIRYSGRLQSDSPSTTQLTLDSAVNLSGGYSYQAHVIIPGSATYLMQESATIAGIPYVQGDIIAGVTTEAAAQVLKDSVTNEAVTVQFSPDIHVETRDISTTGVTNTITVTSAFSTLPEADLTWAITLKDGGDIVTGSAKEYKILGIVEESAGVYGITAAEHYNSKFDLVDEDYLSDPPDYVPRVDSIPQPTNFAASIIKDEKGDTRGPVVSYDRIRLTWTPPEQFINGVSELYKDFDYYEIQYEDDQRELVTKVLSKNVSSYVTPFLTADTSYTFKLQAKSSVGPVSSPQFVTITLTNRATGTIKIFQNGVPQGGTFSAPVKLVGSTLSAPDDYLFTAASTSTKTVTGGV